MSWTRRLLFLVALSAQANPVDFGLREVQRAIAERNLKPEAIKFRTEITSIPPENYKILPGLITGGDMRGLMYGLLDAAEQIRATGRLAASKGAPATQMRGIRWFLHNADLERGWVHSREHWTAFFEMLARHRFNRFNLVFAHQTAYLAPPYPFWFSLAAFPGIKAKGVTADDQRRNLETLRFISQTAADYGIDFTLGVWEHNIQRNMQPSVAGLTPESIGPYSYAALKRVLAECPAIRSVQMRTNSESGIPSADQVAFYRDWVFKAIAESGRRVHLDVRGWLMQKGLYEAAVSSGAPVRMSSKYWAEDLGRPYQPPETWPNYSFLNFLEKPRRHQFYWELWGLGSDRLFLWGDPEYVQRAVGTFGLSGSIGFEIDPPLAQKGFGNRPGEWGVFTAAAQDRVFWKWEWERYWLFYQLWGRLSYNPETPARVWLDEFKRRFGAAGKDAFDAVQGASRVLPELVAAHLADPNMYIWPEVNPGGLIESYREVRPSDWRMIAGFDEHAADVAAGRASAKQTPAETAARFHDFAQQTEQAVARADAALGQAHREWNGMSPDLRALALLARFHGRRQMAADHLAWFYATGEETLSGARRELAGALKVWQDLVKLTDGLYPAQMAFGPEDAGHWKDKLPYVEHDLAWVDERLALLEKYGPADYGFDFGGAVKEGRPNSYRDTQFVASNSVLPGFRAVAPDTVYGGERGYGFLAQAPRTAHALPLAPYLEVRAVSSVPRFLPKNVLFGDWIEGTGAQVFRFDAAPGSYKVTVLLADGSARESETQTADGRIDAVMPDGSWRVAGVVAQRIGQRPPLPARAAAAPARPQLTHTPPKSAAAGKPLTLQLNAWPRTGLTAVRLHYRPLNQLAAWKTLEAPAARAVFTLPGDQLDARWDLQYYFEVLHRTGGWFLPDPLRATPYWVVRVDAPGETAAPPVN